MMLLFSCIYISEMNSKFRLKQNNRNNNKLQKFKVYALYTKGVAFTYLKVNPIDINCITSIS